MNLPLNIDFQQILLHLLNFVILAGGLYLLLYKPVNKFIKKREERFASLSEEADEKLNKAEQLKTECEQLMRTSDDEIAKKKSDAAKKAAEIGETEIEKAREEARKIIINARKDAQAERDKILLETQSQITDIATAAAEKILKESDFETFDKFLSDAERGSDNA